MFRPNEYLKHILDETIFIIQNSADLTYQEFLKDNVMRRAVVRSVEVIGEATKHLNPDFRKNHPEVDWRALAGTRDKLIHDYFGIDYELLWDIVKNHIPELKVRVENILSTL